MRTSRIIALHAALLVAGMLGLAISPAWAAETSGLFDRPLRELHLPLPPDPDNPQAKTQLSCYYYPHLMIKQVDLGGDGADQLSMSFVPKGQAAPACRRENGKDEKIVAAWSGYFQGVKGDYVFFSGEGANGGEGLAVFGSAETTPLFTDLTTKLQAVTLTGPVQDIDQRPWYENPLLLRYRRVYLAPCSMRADAAHCWIRIRQVTGLAQASPPNCDAAYEAMEKHAPQEQLAGVRADPSVIEYEVEAVLDGSGVKRIVPVSAALKCGPAE